MRTSSAGMIAARARADLVSLDFVSFAGRNRITGDIEWLHIWNDLGNPGVEVLDPDTNAPDERVFFGDGTLVEVGAVMMVCEQELTERTLTITVNPLHPVVNNFLRGCDMHEREVFYFQGDFHPVTRKLEAPAECVFAGIIDTVPIITGEAGGQSSAPIQCRSAITEMTRTNSLKRSHASEILRDPNDEFYLDTGVVGEWQTYLGQETPKAMKSA